MEMLDHVYSTSTHPWMHLRAGPFAFSYTSDQLIVTQSLAGEMFETMRLPRYLSWYLV
jgi:hypothetical protein